VAKIAGDFITELRVDRGHALDQDRFDAIVEWIVARVSDERERTRITSIEPSRIEPSSSRSQQQATMR
jgi:hypothetical protein